MVYLKGSFPDNLSNVGKVYIIICDPSRDGQGPLRYLFYRLVVLNADHHFAKVR